MKIYEGNLEITKENAKAFKELVEVTGNVHVHVHVHSNFKAPKLETVGGNVHVNSNFKAPKLEIVGGYVYVYSNFKAPKLEIVGGNVHVSSDFKAPKLEIVGGYVYVYSNFKAPKLETVGGYVYSNFKAPKREENNNELAKLISEMNLNLALWFRGMALMDGILCHVLSKKTRGEVTIYSIKIVGKQKKSYVVERGNVFSHGETIKKALEDLRYKISDRDMSDFEHWKSNLDKKISLDEAIQAYRVITGACESGVRGFVESIEVPDKLTPNVVIELTKGRYGSEDFERFLR